MDEQSKTPSPPLRILLVDDEPNDRILVQRILEREFSKVEIIQVKDRKDLEQALGEKKIDAAILDYELRWTDGLRLLREFKERDPELPVNMFTATGSEEVAVEVMKAGLDDYVLKTSEHLERLRASVVQALERRAARRRCERSPGKIQRAWPVPRGASHPSRPA